MYIDESKYEDFVKLDKQTIVVSTIHKAKGREFDYVYLLLNGLEFTSESKRKLYVGMTRAKRGLTIHYNRANFDFYSNHLNKLLSLFR